MQQPNWNDLRYLLAIKRGQTLGAAARQLRVDDTTVSRRICSLQAALGMQLVLRVGDGRLALTQAGDAVAQRAEAMESQFQSISEIVRADQNLCVGTVRITSVPLLINRLFAGAVGELLKRQPSLVIELVPDSRDLSLTRREADVAVRLGRPAIGGISVKARRIGTLEFAVYAGAATTWRDARGLPWITFDDAMSHLPQAAWIAAVTKGGDSLSGLRVHDAETALEAAVAGLGKTLLPTKVADIDGRLRRLKLEHVRPLPSREIWLLAHNDQIAVRRIAVAMKWVENVVSGSTR